uniref:NADH-ubiquinone oxidoreductase chain 3 n=1 Tax=Ascoschoengastia sp. TATW-1 TaxID=436354 RepID=B3IUN4_9ACAR|nr:NADH dehydrogenase subunit 3 [Ascoschoengastia sp. TATW-1]
MLMMISSFWLIFVLLTIWSIFSFMEKENQIMNSAFESGFESSQTSFIPFSVQYFMVSLVFLIFDLEIVLTLPIPISNDMIKSFMLSSLFMITLVIILFKEMKTSSIDWVK